MVKQIEITVDVNDADYMTEVSDITDEDLEIIRPLIKAIGEFKPYTVEVDGLVWEHRHNYPVECCREDLGEKNTNQMYNFDEEVFETFHEHLPTPFDGRGFHTVKEIKVYEKINEETLLQYLW